MLQQVVLFCCSFIALLFSSIHLSLAQNLCYTPEGITGDCRSIYQCPSILSQTHGRITRRIANYLRSLQCQNGNGQYPHVCCVFNDYDQWQLNHPTQQLSPNAIRGRPDNRRNSVQLPGLGVCGLTSLAHRIYGGDETQLDDYPWMALLEYAPRNRRERKLSCGGSLINNRYVLTAAHCLIGEIEKRVGELVGVRLGEYDLTKTIDCLGNMCADPILVLGVEQKIPHQGYNEKNINRANDIGLIRLNSEVTYSDFVRPICLPSAVNSPRATTNEKFISAGWGRTMTRRQSAVKQQVELPIFDYLECKNKFRELGISLTNDQLCAGGISGYDTCDGDSGNPLMKITANSWIVEGIVSFGRGCGLQDFPAVYTKVANYDSWIRRNLKA